MTRELSHLRQELETLEAETFEIVDYAELDEQMADTCTSTGSSTSTSSTTSTCSTASTSG